MVLNFGNGYNANKNGKCLGVEFMFSGDLLKFLELKLGEQYNQATNDWHEKQPTVKTLNDGALFEYIEMLHFFNYSLWHEEDEARRVDVSDAVIAKVKRNIDKFNQQRNDMIQRIDECVVHLLSQESIDLSKGELNSETIGSICDRISIMSLKVYHMNEIAIDKSESPDLQKQCAEKVVKLLEQQSDLENCRMQLLKDIHSSKRRFKVYFQFKMYNDPNLNKAVKATRNQ